MMNRDERKPTKDEKAKDQADGSQTGASSLSDNPVWKAADLARSAYDLTVEKKIIDPIRQMPGMEQSATTASRLLGVPGLAMTFAAHATDAENKHDPHPLTTASVETAADQLIGRFVPAPVQLGVDAADMAGGVLQQLIEPAVERRVRAQELSTSRSAFSIPDDPRDDILDATGVAGALRAPKQGLEFLSKLISEKALAVLDSASKPEERLSRKEEKPLDVLEHKKPAKCPRVEDKKPERKIEQKPLSALFDSPVEGPSLPAAEESLTRDSHLRMDLGASALRTDRPVTMAERYAPFFSRTSFSVSAAVPPPPRPERPFEKQVRLSAELGERLSDAVKRKDPSKTEQAIAECESKMRGQSDDGAVLLGSMVMRKREALRVLQTAANAVGTSQQGGQLLRSEELLRSENIPTEIRPQVASLLRQREEHFNEAQRRQEHADRNLRRPMGFLWHKTARHGESERDEHRRLGVECEKQALQLVQDYKAGASRLPGCSPR